MRKTLGGAVMVLVCAWAIQERSSSSAAQAENASLAQRVATLEADIKTKSSTSDVAEVRKEIYTDLAGLVRKIDIPKIEIEDLGVVVRKPALQTMRAAKNRNFALGVPDGEEGSDVFGVMVIMPSALQTKAEAISKGN